MKVSSTPVTTRTITLELDEVEATYLVALLGGVSMNVDTDHGKFINDLFWGLDKQLPERIQSFSDYFRGAIACK